jgi:outer membrane immunogenic protein
MNLIAIRKKFVTGVAYSAAVLALAAAIPAVANAQQPTRQAPPARPAAPKQSRPSPSNATWTGLYAGFMLGGGMPDSAASTSTVFSSTGYFATTSVPAIANASPKSFQPNKAQWGAAAGYDYQMGNIVYGGLFDVAKLGANASSASTATYPCCTPTSFTVTQSIETNMLTTVRGRAGYALGNILGFGTLGIAWTGLNYQSVFTDTFAAAHENGGVDSTLHAFAWGLGAEYRSGRNWSVKGEWMRADFGNVTVTSSNLTAFTPSIAFPTNVFTHTASLKMNVLQGSINYRF